MYNINQPTLIITTSQTTTVKIDMPFLNKTDEMLVVGARTFTRIVDLRMMTNPGRNLNMGILVTCSVPCSLCLVELNSASTDLSFLFPETSLGTEFVVSGYKNTSEIEFILIVATKDNTNVAIDKPGDKTERYVLDRLDVLYKAEPFLSASKVTASDPISMIAGSYCPSIPTINSTYCDLIFETIPSKSYYGYHVIFSYMYPRQNYTIGIVALLDYTDVEIFNSKGTVNETIRLSNSDAIYRTYNDFYSGGLTSTKPVLVTQFGHGSDGLFGDPSMMIVPAVTNYGSGYEFNAIPGYISSIGVVISSGYERNLLLDGKRFVPEKTVLVHNQEHGEYLIAYVDVAEGYHSLSHSDQHVTFTGWLYGRAPFGEYATSLGMVSDTKT